MLAPKITYIIMPAGLNCNLACKYCYHGIITSRAERLKPVLMGKDVLKQIIEASAKISYDVSFLWHGGEPLLAGLQHFMDAMEIQRQVKFEGRVRNILQSNMTLMTRRKAKFFFDNGFLVSTSLDGSKESHDSNRIFHQGCGSHVSVLKAISRFNKLGGSIGSICLITKSNVNDPDGTYREMLKSGVTSFSYHICSQDEDGSIDALPTPEEVTVFTIRLFNLWFRDDNPEFKIRNFRNVIRGLCGGDPLECSSKTSVCRAFIAFDPSGNVYPCHRFVGREEFVIGNVLERPLQKIFDESTALYDQMAVVPEKCQRCEWLDVCGAGCAFERFVENGTFDSVGVDCEIKKPLFAHIKRKIKHLI